MAGNEAEEMYVSEVYRPSRREDVVDVFRRATFISAFIIVMVAVLAFVVFSPLMLRQLGSIRGVNWTQLSNIGQTYGAASALLTGLALIGVVGSIVFQARAIEVSRWDSRRDKHMHLIEIALADPIYMRAWGHDLDVLGGPDRSRQLFYINLIISFWEDLYKLNNLQENILRGNLAILFRGEAGREFWVIGRHVRLQMSHNRRSRRFSSIVEEEYQKAISAGPPTVQAEGHSLISSSSKQSLLRDSAKKNGALLLLGVIGGIAFGTRLRRRSCQLRVLRQSHLEVLCQSHFMAI